MTALSRRQLFILAATLAAARPLAAGTLPNMHVVKDANCGCCNDWIGHVRDAGFPVSFEEMEPGALADLKASLGLQTSQMSCHTARVEGYVIEGHVPAKDIARLLREKPKGVKGLAVAGMPMGSPGMEHGDHREAYKVMTFGSGGQRVYASYAASGGAHAH